jgi:hypothetical protein
MVKIRASTLVAGFSGASPMKSLGASALVLKGSGRMSWSKKALIIANAPYTIEKPTLGQAETRIHFGNIASRAKGARGLDPATGLPGAAGAIAKAMGGYRAAHSMPKESYPSRRGGYHTVQQLQGMVQRALGGGRTAPAQAPGAMIPF